MSHKMCSLVPQKKNCTKKGGLIYFEKGSGWTNPYKPVLRCAFSNNCEQLHEEYMKLVGKNGSAFEVRGRNASIFMKYIKL